ncbi:type III-A CRISPR-associated protein Cas10/Csm1 [Desulfoscipio gibsoniae]
MDLVNTVTVGSLLHDIGKVLHRGSNLDSRAHSISGMDWLKKFTDDQDILDCIRFHHHQDIKDANLRKDSAAYVVYLADNISSGIDRREIEGQTLTGFDKKRLQESVYNLLNNSNRQDVYPVAAIKETIDYPAEKYNYETANSYNKIIFAITEGLRGITFEPEYINSLLELTEAYLSYIPSSTYQGEVSDISLFDHSKVTAAVAACMVLYLQSHDRNDFKAELFTHRQKFYKENAFCLFACDISGIQQFIYTISSKGALKGLRSRSFYLEVLLENLVDEILGAVFLSRANLLYTGGGHAYILLPNTVEAKEQAVGAVVNTNRKLREHFEARLYIAYGMQDCSAGELMAKTDDSEAYANIFRSVATRISELKLRRYSADELRQLNDSAVDDLGRECGICGQSGKLEECADGMICQNCAAFADIANLLIKQDAVFAVLKEEIASRALPLFSAQGDHLYLYTLTADRVRDLLKTSGDKVVRIYSKNTYRTGFSLATKLWMGDYAVRNQAGDLKTFFELAVSSQGIGRIGVLRADVDNMGAAFVNGFIREQDKDNKYRYLTLSRTAALSRSLSIFFKYYLNDLLLHGEKSILAAADYRNLVVVYAGGDDLFIVGAWNECLAAALDIRRAFARYTGNALTISAGFAVFDQAYPIARMAAETAELEDDAKQYVHSSGSKNAISLFGRELHNGKLTSQHTYDWAAFESKVLGEKYALLAKLFEAAQDDYGNSFLYNILALLREAENTINLARLAYTLARREPSKSASEEVKKIYGEFARSIYSWALEDEDRRQLITAIIIYTYAKREKKEAEISG